MNTHGLINFFIPFFNQIFTEIIVTTCPDCFNLYKNNYSLIEHILQSFDLYALGILNPLGIFM